MSDQAGNNVIENFFLLGPNNFYAEFILEKSYIDPGSACAIKSYKHAPIVLNSAYSMVPEGLKQDPSSTTRIYLVARRLVPSVGTNRGLGWAYNPVSNNLGFQFEGTYTSTHGLVKSLPADDFLKQPEVITAKQIFSTVKT